MWPSNVSTCFSASFCVGVVIVISTGTLRYELSFYLLTFSSPLFNCMIPPKPQGPDDWLFVSFVIQSQTNLSLCIFSLG